MEQDPAARKVLSKPYWEGTICWRGDRRRQPSGLVVSEAIQFRSRAAAAEFLFAGQAVDDKWAKT
ncbi:hypothetical protein BV509_21080 [Rhodovulum sulfidophilum]|nr:hypothetical protein BV509_21080 [Rhodovulum sulfidophilum]